MGRGMAVAKMGKIPSLVTRARALQSDNFGGPAIHQTIPSYTQISEICSQKILQSKINKQLNIPRNTIINLK